MFNRNHRNFISERGVETRSEKTLKLTKQLRAEKKKVADLMNTVRDLRHAYDRLMEDNHKLAEDHEDAVLTMMRMESPGGVKKKRKIEKK